MTDEQRMREQFEKWEQTEAAAFLDDPDHCNYSLAEAVWLHAWLARDAEVQALREALESIHYRATRWEVLPTVEAHQSVLQDIGEDALAALAGEGGDSE